MLFISPPFGNYIQFLPHTIPITGSFTVEPRPGLLSQIIQTLRYSCIYKGWINQIGLRNKGIDYAIKNYKSDSIMSIAILKDSDVDYFHKKLPADANIEINISCPNADVKLPNNINKLINSEREWCIMKLSPNDTNKKIDNLHLLGFNQFHCCNTYKLPAGGLSGPFLIPYVQNKVEYIKNNYPKSTVIAGGGIRNMDSLKYYRKAGADHFSVSSLCFNPFAFSLFYYYYLKLK